MPAYMIFDLKITEPALWAEYQQMAGPLLIAAGGRFLASSPAPEVLEGDWSPATLSLVEFPSLEAARTFYNSPAYQATIPLRLRAAVGSGVLIGGPT